MRTPLSVVPPLGPLPRAQFEAFRSLFLYFVYIPLKVFDMEPPLFFFRDSILLFGKVPSLYAKKFVSLLIVVVCNLH